MEHRSGHQYVCGSRAHLNHHHHHNHPYSSSLSQVTHLRQSAIGSSHDLPCSSSISFTMGALKEYPRDGSTNTQKCSTSDTDFTESSSDDFHDRHHFSMDYDQAKILDQSASVWRSTKYYHNQEPDETATPKSITIHQKAETMSLKSALKSPESMKPLQNGMAMNAPITLRLNSVQMDENTPFQSAMNSTQKQGKRPAQNGFTKKHKGESVAARKTHMPSKWENAEKWLSIQNNNDASIQRNSYNGVTDITPDRGNHSCASQSSESDRGSVRKRIKDEPSITTPKLSTAVALSSDNGISANRSTPRPSEVNVDCNYVLQMEHHKQSPITYSRRLMKQNQILMKIRRKCMGNTMETKLGQPSFCGVSGDGVAKVTSAKGKGEDDGNARLTEVVLLTTNHGRSSSMRDAFTEVSPSISKRDMATQMTPLSSSCVSPARKSSPLRHNTPIKIRSNNDTSTSANRSTNQAKSDHHVNIVELESCHFAKLELRDLPSGSHVFQSFDESIDCGSDPTSNQTPTTLEAEINYTGENHVGVNNTNSSSMRSSCSILDVRAAAWEEAERAKLMAKFRQEQARIEAWENFQKAKAEAELKKIEVKLEKIRNKVSEKVMNKISAAERRAHEMRTIAEAHQEDQMRRLAERAANLRKTDNASVSSATSHFPGSFAVCFARSLMS